MRLESDSGAPCLILEDGEALSDFEVFVSGLRVNNGLVRFCKAISEAKLESVQLRGRDNAHLILIPECFRDSLDDRYNIAIEDSKDIGSRVEFNYSWTERLLSLNSTHGNVDSVSMTGIKGWYKNTFYTVNDAHSPRLSIFVNGKKLDDITCDLPRTDVESIHGSEFLHTGFDYTWPIGLNIDTVEIRESGSDVCVINTPLKITNQRAEIQRLEKTLRSLRFETANDQMQFSQDTVSKMFNALREGETGDFATGTDSRYLSMDKEPGVSVIIPVYNSLNELKDCIKSLLAMECKTRYEILLVNDGSPDPSVHPYLAELQIHYPWIHVVRSEINRGFVMTVNKALAARRYNDVVILNSDTIVPNGMVDRLKSIQDSHPEFGVITPLSNNATIFSFPRTLYNNALGDQESRASIDEFLAVKAGDTIMDVPTANGYCMYVRGEVFDAVGVLNEDEWGVGYAEENDFCQKVKMAGWGIAAYYGMYVGHVGSTSFGEDTREELVATNLTRLNELYPEYDAVIQHYIKNDSASRLCHNSLQLKHFKSRSQDKGEAIILYALHDLGGGTDEYVKRCTADLVDDNVTVLKLISEGFDTLVLTDSPGSIRCEYKTTSSEIERMCDDLKSLKLLDIVLNSAFNFSEKLLNNLTSLSTPYTVVVHDFSWLCPKINMIDARGSFCGMPSEDVCQTCVEVSGVPGALAPDWKEKSENIGDWISTNTEILANARQVICPSYDTAVRLQSKFKNIDPIVRYHSDSFPVPVVVHNTNPVRIDNGLETQKIAVFGRIGQHKGMAVLKNLIWLLSSRHPGVEIIFFGELCEYKWLEGYKNVKFVGEYEEDSLCGMIAEQQPSMALFLSVWPETYCYALTDAIRNGVYPVVFDIGAFKERIEMHNFGSTISFSTDSETIYKEIADLVSSRRYLSARPLEIKGGTRYPSFLNDNMGISVTEKKKIANV